MPSVYDVYPDKWLRADVIGNKAVAVTIEKVTVEKLYNSTARKYEDKLVVTFVDKELRLICNKTQTFALAEICGSDDYTRWKGHRVRLTTTRASNGKLTIVVSRAATQTQGRSPELTPAAAPMVATEEPVDNPWESDTPDDPDVDFYPEEHPAKQPLPQESPGRGQDDPGARPLNTGSDLCPVCHAPTGKPHATSCTATQVKAGARPAVAEKPVHGQEGAPKNPAGAPSGARPAAHSPQPVARPLTLEDRIFAAVSAIYESSVPLQKNTSEFIRKCRNAEHDSAMKMSFKYYEAIITMIKEVLGAEDNEAEMVLAALLGYRCTATVLPGQLVHGYLMKPLRNNDADALKALGEIYELCIAIWMEQQEESYANGN